MIIAKLMISLVIMPESLGPNKMISVVKGRMSFHPYLHTLFILHLAPKVLHWYTGTLDHDYPQTLAA
jgi:hypothetical protein